MPGFSILATLPRLRRTILTSEAEIDNFRDDWKELVARSEANEPTLSPEWMLAWWHEFGPCEGRQLRILLVHDEGRLIGIAPLLARRHWYRPGIPFRRLEPLASGEPESDEIWSENLNIIAKRAAEGAVVEEVADALEAGDLGPWDEFILPRMDGDGPIPQLLVGAFRRRGFVAAADVTGRSFFIELPSTWNEYLAGLTKRRRYTLTRPLRDFDKWAAGQARFEQATTAEELERGKGILISLHSQRWQAEGLDGAFASPRFLAFHESIMPWLLQEGALELLWLTVRDEPIAAQYNIVWEDKVYFYQCGRKVDLPEEIRPGTVLLAHAIRQAIERGRREFYFLGSEMRYKTLLASGHRPRVEVRVARPSLVETAHQVIERGMDLARQVRAAARRRGVNREKH